MTSRSAVVPRAGGPLQEVVGESFHRASFETLFGPRGEYSKDRIRKAVLRPEPDNPYDCNAVVVQIDGLVVGHLPRAAAAQWQRKVFATGIDAVTCDAFVTTGWEGRRGQGDACVELSVSIDRALAAAR